MTRIWKADAGHADDADLEEPTRIARITRIGKP
jgi:hypothetical protein